MWFFRQIKVDCQSEPKWNSMKLPCELQSGLIFFAFSYYFACLSSRPLFTLLFTQNFPRSIDGLILSAYLSLSLPILVNSFPLLLPRSFPSSLSFSSLTVCCPFIHSLHSRHLISSHVHYNPLEVNWYSW